MGPALQALLTLVTTVVLALSAFAAFAQQSKSVDGVVLQLGIMSAERAVHAEGHREAHPATFPGGSQHVLITLADAEGRFDAATCASIRAIPAAWEAGAGA